MPRAPGLWFREQNGFWYTKVAGQQIKLSQDKREARTLFHKMMARDKPAATGTACQLSVRKLCDTYLDRTRADKSDGRHEVQVLHLKKFTAGFGHRRPESLKPHEVNDWLATLTLGGSTKALCVTIVKAAFNWATREGYLQASPLTGLKRRKVARRERVLTRDEQRRVFERVSPAFRDFLTVLVKTGCRPFTEAARLTAAAIDFEKGRSAFTKHKNAKKGKPRVVYYPPPVLARLKELAEERPEGLLFRNRQGDAWNRDNVSKYLGHVAADLGIERFPCYSLRTTYISAALAKGVPVETVAALCGNSPRIIYQHYNSVDKREDALRDASLKAIG